MIIAALINAQKANIDLTFDQALPSTLPPKAPAKTWLMRYIRRLTRR